MLSKTQCLIVAGALAILTASPALGQAPIRSLAGTFHFSQERGPVRTVGMSPTRDAFSSEVLAGPNSGLNSAYIIHSRIAAGTRARGLYVLPVDHTFLVLSGRLNVQIGTDKFVADPETLVLVPAGVPHRVWNEGTDPEADFEVMAPGHSADLASMIKPAQPRKVDNAAQYVRVPPHLDKLAGGTGHDSLNERVLADRATGSQFVLERLNEVLHGGGRTEPHIHPFDQVYFIRKGVMTVLYGMSSFEARENSVVVLPAGVVHNNANDGEGVQSSITLLLPEPEKGQPLGASVTIQKRGTPATP